MFNADIIFLQYLHAHILHGVYNITVYVLSTIVKIDISKLSEQYLHTSIEKY